MSEIRKIAIIGPECTGKSELSRFLASHYHTEWVPEYARAYIDNLNRAYTQDDLLKIAHGQLRLEDEYARDASKVLICDTNLYVIKIWSEFKYGNCAEEILKQISTRHYDLYLLTYVDIPWEEDPQREHPARREELYQIYYQHMKAQNVPFVEIKGERGQRQAAAIHGIDPLL